MTLSGLLQVLILLLFSLTVNTAYAETPYPYTSTARDWTSSRADSPYYDDLRHKPGYQNSNSGHVGADLPEYQFDARSREYQRERTAPMPPLDGKEWTPERNKYCTNKPLCGGGD